MAKARKPNRKRQGRTTRQRRPRTPRGVRRLTWANAYVVAAMAILAAVPLGLNRPIAWLIFGAVVSAWLVIYILVLERISPGHHSLSRSDRMLLWLAALVPAWALGQAVPLPAGLLDADGTAISLLPTASAMGALRFLIYILFFYLAFAAGSRAERADRLMWLLFAGVVAHAIWGLIALNVLDDAALWGEKTAYLGFATGSFVNRNSFATFLSIGACIGAALMLGQIQPGAGRSPSGKMVRGLDLAVILLGLLAIWLALLATQSRLGVAGCLVGTGLCVLIFQLRRGTGLLRILIGAGVFALILVVGLVMTGGGLGERMIFLGEGTRLRLAAYGFVAELIAAKPLLGHGFDAFRPAFEGVHRPPLPGDFFWDRAHSTYLSHWVELGVLVGSVPILLGGIVIGRLVHAIRSAEGSIVSAVATLAAIAATGIQSIADFGLEMPANALLLTGLVGLTLGKMSDRRS